MRHCSFVYNGKFTVTTLKLKSLSTLFRLSRFSDAGRQLPKIKNGEYWSANCVHTGTNSRVRKITHSSEFILSHSYVNVVQVYNLLNYYLFKKNS